jgi:3-hydroxyacyl-[acyl-carrier-protein] dehydratase
MDIHQILQYLPHRFPFLLVDRVLACEPGARIHALKNVSINEPFFPGHFPHHPVMPGVLIIESLAQAAAILSFKTVKSRPNGGSVYYLAGVESARFKRPVHAGDQLHLEVELIRHMRDVYKFKAIARVDGQLTAECEITCVRRSIA